MPMISVKISVDGDWPSSDDITTRNAIIEQVDAAEIGICTGAGGGMGAMDFSYEVADMARARNLIEAALKKHLPNRKYHIHVSAE